tara:strand:+ start:251 stop:499 length:249 start_codon:yes stop_codon:yes gene_type:complete
MQAQRLHPLVLVGGMTKNVFKRIEEYGDGCMPNRVTPEDINKGRAALDELERSGARPQVHSDNGVWTAGGLRPAQRLGRGWG